MATITITPGNSFTATETVTSTKLNDLGSPTAALTAASIGTADIADDAITPALIADDAITTPSIADNAITTALIADDAVTTALIADDAITTALIADDAVTPSQLSAGAPSWNASGTLNTTELSTSVVVAPESDNALTLKSDPESPDPSTGGAQISLHSQDSAVPSQVYVKSSFTYFQNMSGGIVASISPTNTPTAGSDLLRKDTFTPSTYNGGESVTLPNGLIMKFGSKSVSGDSTASVSFSEAFPDSIVQVQLTIKTNIPTNSDAGLSAISQTTSGFTIQNGAFGTETISWMAIGY